MAEQQRFDLLILGGGMSYVGAIRAAQLGLKVGLVERDKMGGTCLNDTPTPTVHGALEDVTTAQPAVDAEQPDLITTGGTR